MVHIKKGELTQEEKELLEVIGKGNGCWAATEALPIWPGGVAEPRRRPWPRRPWAAVLRGWQPWTGNSVSPFGLGPVAGAEGWGGSGGCRGSSFTSAFGKVQVRAQIITSDPRVWAPVCAIFGTPQVIVTTVSVGNSGLIPSFRFLEGCLKGCFDFRRPKDLDSLAVPAPAWGWRELLRRRVLY